MSLAFLTAESFETPCTVTVEQSAEEKIAHAREWMIRSLQAGIETGSDDGDMEWIAYRRLIESWREVLPTQSWCLQVPLAA